MPNDRFGRLGSVGFYFVSTILKILQYFQGSTVVLSAVYSSTFKEVLA